MPFDANTSRDYLVSQIGHTNKLVLENAKTVNVYIKGSHNNVVLNAPQLQNANFSGNVNSSVILQSQERVNVTNSPENRSTEGDCCWEQRSETEVGSQYDSSVDADSVTSVYTDSLASVDAEYVASDNAYSFASVTEDAETLVKADAATLVNGNNFESAIANTFASVTEDAAVNLAGELTERCGGTLVKPGDHVWILRHHDARRSSVCFAIYVGGGEVITVLRGDNEVRTIDVARGGEFYVYWSCGNVSRVYSRAEMIERSRQRLGRRYRTSVDFVDDVRGVLHDATSEM